MISNLDNFGNEAPSAKEPNSASAMMKKHLLGDFTLYKVNKEFENF